MVDENSPGLGGDLREDDSALTGREPVIKGEGSKLLADRRGAYLAGNLNGLIYHMNRAQWIRFRQVCARIAVRHARLFLSGYKSTYPGDSRPGTALEIVGSWIDNPTPDNLDAVQAVRGDAEQAHAMALMNAWESRYDDDESQQLKVDALACASYAYDGVRMALMRPGKESAALRQWQLVAARKRMMLRTACVILQRE